MTFYEAEQKLQKKTDSIFQFAIKLSNDDVII